MPVTEFMDKTEEGIYRALERLGGIANILSLQISVAAIDALDRLIQRGQVRKVGYAVEIVPEPVRKTDTPAENSPQARIMHAKPSKSYREGRRQHYSPLVGPLPARIRQLSARMVHWINTWGDQDAQGLPICEKRALERGLHAHRLPEWTPAIDFLLQRRAISINGRQVSILDIGCDRDLPDPHDPTEKKKARELKQAKRRSRPKRPLSAWVRRKILERGGTIPYGR